MEWAGKSNVNSINTSWKLGRNGENELREKMS